MLLLILILPYLVTSNPKYPITPCAESPETPEDRRSNLQRLRVVAFNAEWLFDGTTSRDPWTPEEAEIHLLEVAKIMAEVNPDILSLEEVQDCDILQRLADEMEKNGAPGLIPYLIPGKDTATMQNVALLTRIDPYVDVMRTENRVAWPIAGNKCNYEGDSGTYGVSKHYLAKFHVNGIDLSMIGLHFLAFPTTKDRCAKREAQASVLRGLANDAFAAGEEVIILGDYNDYSDKVPDIVSNVPNSRVMQILRDGLVDKDNISISFADSMHEISSKIDQTERYTSIYSGGKLSQIDHILVSDGLYKFMDKAFVSHLYPGGEVSDHWPIGFDLDFTLELPMQNHSSVSSTQSSAPSSLSSVGFKYIVFVLLGYLYNGM